MFVISVIVAVVLGGFGWGLTEYLLHRFAGHGPNRRREGLWYLSPKVVLVLFNEEHIAHHRDPTYFAPTWKKAIATALLLPVIGGLATLLVGWALGLAFGAGFAVTYLAYEVLHRRIHTHAPVNAYFAWMRRHHLHHHVSPKVNHGVTSPVWDLAFATHVVADPVALNHKIAPPWLLDETGALRPEFAREYKLVGRA
ncbi:MAG: sterol desaturase family protein [Myxococcaceae bacterium]|nr:sterol desaturase family protein [Myxococcaceae bacterium]